MASVRTENGTLAAQGLSPAEAEQQAAILNKRAEKLGIATRYEVSH